MGESLARVRAARHDEPVSGSGVSPLDVANTVIAAAAFAAAVASLVWQGVTWKLEGSRVRTELRVGALHQNPGIRDVITYPARRHWSWVEEAGKHGFTRKALFLTVRSIGRQPVTVERWVVVFPGGQRITQLRSGLGPDLPHRLDVGEPGTWAIELNTLTPGAALAREERVWKVLWRRRAIRVRLEVELGSGQIVRTSRWRRARVDV
jgi:hypothetical protein